MLTVGTTAKVQPARHVSFMTHVVRLPDGTLTRDGQPLAEGAYCRSLLRTLDLFCPITGDRRPRVADLGCLEGGFALTFAQAGYEVVGIEGRRSNIERCQFLASAFRLPQLSYTHEDVRNVAAYGRFDAIFCAGLLYHLDQPVAFLRLLGSLTERLLMVQTH